jgi:hypothetical protein
MYNAVWVYNFRYPKKKKRSAQQMATLEELFYEDEQDISVWDEFVKCGDVMRYCWDGVTLTWYGQPMRCKPESRDIHITELRLSDFEYCGLEGKTVPQTVKDWAIIPNHLYLPRLYDIYQKLKRDDEQDISVWDEYVKRDVKPGDKISDTWDGQKLIWKGQPMRRKPESRDIYIWELMLSDFEPCEDEKPKHGYPEQKKDNQNPIIQYSVQIGERSGDGRIGKK